MRWRNLAAISWRTRQNVAFGVGELDEYKTERYGGKALLLQTVYKSSERGLTTVFSYRHIGNSTRDRDLFWAVSGRLPDTLIAAWKYSQLDVDRDRMIREGELFSSQMKKMFGNIRRGRKCSKKLAVSCDFDHNGGLSLEEWRKCLGRRTTPNLGTELFSIVFFKICLTSFV